MNAAARDSWSRRVETVLTAHRAAVDRIKALSTRQTGLIDSAQGDVLLAVLTERQHALDALMKGPDSLPMLLQDLEASAEWIDQSLNDHVRAELHVLAADLQHIAAADERDRGTIQEVCRRLQQDIAETGTVRQARAAYAGRPGASSTFSDRHG